MRTSPSSGSLTGGPKNQTRLDLKALLETQDFCLDMVRCSIICLAYCLIVPCKSVHELLSCRNIPDVCVVIYHCWVYQFIIVQLGEILIYQPFLVRLGQESHYGMSPKGGISRIFITMTIPIPIFDLLDIQFVNVDTD